MSTDDVLGMYFLALLIFGGAAAIVAITLESIASTLRSIEHALDRINSSAIWRR